MHILCIHGNNRASAFRISKPTVPSNPFESELNSLKAFRIKSNFSEKQRRRKPTIRKKESAANFWRPFPPRLPHLLLLPIRIWLLVVVVFVVPHTLIAPTHTHTHPSGPNNFGALFSYFSKLFSPPPFAAPGPPPLLLTHFLFDSENFCVAWPSPNCGWLQILGVLPNHELRQIGNIFAPPLSSSFLPPPLFLSLKSHTECVFVVLPGWPPGPAEKRVFVGVGGAPWRCPDAQPPATHYKHFKSFCPSRNDSLPRSFRS